MISMVSDLGAAILFFAVLYFIIKQAVKKAIIEAKVYEASLTLDVITDREFSELSAIFYGSTGMGTEIFKGLEKEQKKEFKPEWKELSKEFHTLWMKLAYSNVPKSEAHEALRVIHDKVADLIERVDALKTSAANEE